MGETRRRTLLRWAAVVGGAAAVSTAAVVGGLLWDARGPAVEAAATDAYQQPPACASVPAAAVEAVAPAAVLEADTSGPLPQSAERSCVWSSLEASGADPRVLVVSFRTHFGDGDGRVSGEERAEAELAALAGAAPAAAAELPGADALVRPAAVGDGVEAVFRDGNLTVRVWCGGMPAEEAREAASAVAAEVAAAL